MKTANGIISVVQEHRFQLEEESGRHQLFILAPDAALEWDDLARLEREHCPVMVRYTDADGLLASTAHAVYERNGAAS